jgi:hypothetical protein
MGGTGFSVHHICLGNVVASRETQYSFRAPSSTASGQFKPNLPWKPDGVARGGHMIGRATSG